ncbi:CxxxxCH/CxxCH domain-containing protein [Cupriavidus numazuensis]
MRARRNRCAACLARVLSRGLTAGGGRSCREVLCHSSAALSPMPRWNDTKPCFLGRSGYLKP